jgi:hypothetical protein
MRYEDGQQTGGFSDQDKFGETSKFGNAASNAADTADRAASGVRDAVNNAEQTIGERAGQLKDSLAANLETGADSLRRRSTDTRGLDNAVNATKDKVAGVSDRVATGMEQTAGWLRSADMTSIQQGLEKQVKENPGRTLLFAAGIGYLLGRALKGKDI